MSGFRVVLVLQVKPRRQGSLNGVTRILLGRCRTAFEKVRTVRVSGVRARRAAQCVLGNVQGMATCSRGTSHYLTGK